MNKPTTIPRVNLQTHINLIVRQGKLVTESKRIAIFNAKRAA